MKRNPSDDDSGCRAPAAAITNVWQPKVISPGLGREYASHVEELGRLLESFSLARYVECDLNDPLSEMDHSHLVDFMKFLQVVGHLDFIAQFDMNEARAIWDKHVPKSVGVLVFLHPLMYEYEEIFRRIAAAYPEGDIPDGELIDQATFSEYCGVRITLAPYDEPSLLAYAADLSAKRSIKTGPGKRRLAS